MTKHVRVTAVLPAQACWGLVRAFWLSAALTAAVGCLILPTYARDQMAEALADHFAFAGHSLSGIASNLMPIMSSVKGHRYPYCQLYFLSHRHTDAVCHANDLSDLYGSHNVDAWDTCCDACLSGSDSLCWKLCSFYTCHKRLCMLQEVNSPSGVKLDVFAYA